MAGPLDFIKEKGANAFDLLKHLYGETRLSGGEGLFRVAPQLKSVRAKDSVRYGLGDYLDMVPQEGGLEFQGILEILKKRELNERIKELVGIQNAKQGNLDAYSGNNWSSVPPTYGNMTPDMFKDAQTAYSDYKQAPANLLQLLRSYVSDKPGPAYLERGWGNDYQGDTPGAVERVGPQPTQSAPDDR